MLSCDDWRTHDRRSNELTCHSLGYSGDASGANARERSLTPREEAFDARTGLIGGACDALREEGDPPVPVAICAEVEKPVLVGLSSPFEPRRDDQNWFSQHGVLHE